MTWALSTRPSLFFSACLSVCLPVRRALTRKTTFYGRRSRIQQVKARRCSLAPSLPRSAVFYDLRVRWGRGEGRRRSEPRCALKRGKGRGGNGRGGEGRLLPFGSLNANLLFLHGKADAACACGRLVAVVARNSQSVLVRNS